MLRTLNKSIVVHMLGNIEHGSYFISVKALLRHWYQMTYDHCKQMPYGFLLIDMQIFDSRNPGHVNHWQTA